MHGLRKEYKWNGNPPKRQKAATKNKANGDTGKASQHKDYHKRKICPVIGCLTTTVKMSAHLKLCHKMEVSPEYYELLKSARPFIAYTDEVKQCVRDTCRREEERRDLVAKTTEIYDGQEVARCLIYSRKIQKVKIMRLFW